MVKPEQMSLTAHQHIQKYLESIHNTVISKEELNAILRLSQHLRVFGLLSAAAYVNQTNAQEGKVRSRILPVWKSLLGQLINSETPPSEEELREIVVQMAREEPAKYMVTWRKAMILSNHWNFWARAYSA
ncbi:MULTISPECIES: hypothetical protein [Nostocales]|uniref:hypothetical protein n=1 Tax=Nostocales TaxID=1161 RepID=UPI00168409EA|nr:MULTISPECIES: hypothetical protein [Nostocales]MBD2302810.1 hypothetical protein [Nostoc sp. FACHB-190]MBD2492184.1 hypothetical protein [Aulosira sp. FACHB-615]